MNIPDSLLSDFSKFTDSGEDPNKERLIYATVTNVSEDEKDVTVMFDGADNLTTTCRTSVECKVGDRVIINWKNRGAVVTANLTRRTISVDKVVAIRAEIEDLVATKATIAQLNATKAEIETLVATKATIAQLNAATARIGTLETDNVTIKGKLTAAEASIQQLDATKITAAQLEAGTLNIKGNLTGSTGSFNGDLNTNWNSGTQSGTVRLANTSAGAPIHIQAQNSGDTANVMQFTPGPNGGLVVSRGNSQTLIGGQGINSGGVVLSGGNVSAGSGSVYDHYGKLISSSTSSIEYMNYVPSTENADAYIHVTSTYYGNWGITIWASDRELKKDIEDSGIKAIDILKKIRHRKFKWKDSGRQVDIGYIAQEIMDVIPGSTIKPEGGYYQIDSSAIIPYITKALVEQDEKIEALEKRIEALEKGR